MNNTIHRLIVILFFALAILTVCGILFRNADYYLLPQEERPFHARYDQLKPSGMESHGYGIIGSAMLMIGVATYSSRKRFRKFQHIGKIKYFLEFHIFLCLFGPMLILYHTTFKFGGIVSVGFWSMAAVAMSGIVGRYLYVQIPKGIQGDELDVKELEQVNDALQHQLQDQFGLDEIDLKKIDALAAPPQRRYDSLFSLLLFFVAGDITLRSRLRKIIQHLHSRSVDQSIARMVVHVAGQRIRLIRRIMFLEKLRYYFHYWHIIHLPFSMIMFIILFLHVAVAIAFGYTWIW